METRHAAEDSHEQLEAYRTVEKVAELTNFIKYKNSNVESFRSLYIQIFKDCEDLACKEKLQGKSNEEIIKIIEEKMRRHS